MATWGESEVVRDLLKGCRACRSGPRPPSPPGGGLGTFLKVRK
jgi:hypothetical protein